MTGFMIHFLICNLIISGITGSVLLIRRFLAGRLTGRTQYRLWFLYLGLLMIPFLPSRLFQSMEKWTDRFHFPGILSGTTSADVQYAAADSINAPPGIIQDFAISASRHIPPSLGTILFVLWTAGIIASLLLSLPSFVQLKNIRQSALPLQDEHIRQLYHNCLKQTGIRSRLPVFTTAVLKSPALAGFFRPAVYLPLHVISDCNETELRHMILHELMHYRYKDHVINIIIYAAGIFYWFNPILRLSVSTIRTDCETACDTSVLNLLEPEDFHSYGTTLIHAAETMSARPILFISGISAGMRQMKHRIRTISTYKKPDLKKQILSSIAFLVTGILAFGAAPVLCSDAAIRDCYHWTYQKTEVTDLDLSSHFGDFCGTFVLYNPVSDHWTVYNPELAALRKSPDSTYKIYSALIGLKKKVITPEHTERKWNHTAYPFESWECDQDLNSAMANSVNWYFQEIDEQSGEQTISEMLHRIHYGNGKIRNNPESFWMESSLKIAPVEQVLLLTKLCQNQLPFSRAEMDTVKNSLYISSSPAGDLYGKTGTGRINGKDVSGWFVGWISSGSRSSIFAVHIGADSEATGIKASEIALSILTEQNLWQ